MNDGCTVRVTFLQMDMSIFVYHLFDCTSQDIRESFHPDKGILGPSLCLSTENFAEKALSYLQSPVPFLLF